MFYGGKPNRSIGLGEVKIPRLLKMFYGNRPVRFFHRKRVTIPARNGNPGIFYIGFLMVGG